MCTTEPLTIVVTPGVACANCGAPEVANPDAPVSEWRFNIRAYRVDDWSECRVCGAWFNMEGRVQLPAKEA